MTNKLKINLLLFLVIVVSGVFLFPKMTQADTTGPTTVVGYCYTMNWGSPPRPAFRVYWLDKGGTLGNYSLIKRVSTDSGETYGDWVAFMSGDQFKLSRDGGVIGMGKDVDIRDGDWIQYAVWTWRLGRWELSNMTTVPAIASHCGLPDAPEMIVTCTGAGASRQIIVDWTIVRNAKYNIVRKRNMAGDWEQPDKIWELGPLPRTNVIGSGGPGFQITRWVDSNPPTTRTWAYQVKSDVGVASQVSGTIDQICAGGNQTPRSFLEPVNCSGVTGWAYDPDIPSQSIPVHIYVDGGFEAAITANGNWRSDVNTYFGITGNHAFWWAIPNEFKDGSTHVIQTYGIDNEGKVNPESGGSPRTMPACTPPNNPPTGNHQIATCISTTGWAKDPDTSSPIRVHIYKDAKVNQGGVRVANILANKPNASVAGDHGFSWTIPASLKNGVSHPLYAYAIDSAGGSSPMIPNTPRSINCGTWDVSLTANPNSGMTPLNPTLTAVGTGTATGNIQWELDCTNDGTFEFSVTNNTSTTSASVCTYSTAGTHTAKVRSTRQNIVATATTTITVVSPTWNISVSANPSSGTVPLSSVITAKKVSGSTATGSTAWTFNCGDGNGDITKPTAAGVEQSTYTFTYNSQGAYTA